MTTFDNAYDEERIEVLTQIKSTAQTLLDTALQLNKLVVDTGDIGEISYDAFATLVGMFKTLDKNYNIQTLVDDALDKE